jgi:hypothetical protein
MVTELKKRRGPEWLEEPLKMARFHCYIYKVSQEFGAILQEHTEGSL